MSYPFFYFQKSIDSKHRWIRVIVSKKEHRDYGSWGDRKYIHENPYYPMDRLIENWTQCDIEFARKFLDEVDPTNPFFIDYPHRMFPINSIDIEKEVLRIMKEENNPLLYPKELVDED